MSRTLCNYYKYISPYRNLTSRSIRPPYTAKYSSLNIHLYSPFASTAAAVGRLSPRLAPQATPDRSALRPPVRSRPAAGGCYLCHHRTADGATAALRQVKQTTAGSRRRCRRVEIVDIGRWVMHDLMRFTAGLPLITGPTSGGARWLSQFSLAIILVPESDAQWRHCEPAMRKSAAKSGGERGRWTHYWRGNNGARQPPAAACFVVLRELQSVLCPPTGRHVETL